MNEALGERGKKWGQKYLPGKIWNGFESSFSILDIVLYVI